MEAVLRRARKRVTAYARLLSAIEGRPLTDYVCVAWDGSHINFGNYTAEQQFVWEPLIAFDAPAARRLLAYLGKDGACSLSPRLLTDLAGPATSCAATLIPLFFAAIRAASGSSTKTSRLFTAWKQLCGHMAGSRQLQTLPGKSQISTEDPSAYLFALQTYIALIARLVAALALASRSYDPGDRAVPLHRRIQALETGRLFEAAGLSQMLQGDFFSWYADDVRWDDFCPEIECLIQRLKAIASPGAQKSPDAPQDLFKDLYQAFVPGALRHALGEYYTPDWLVAHALDTMEWSIEQELLDPTCGSGAFLLEGLRRRLAARDGETRPGAGELLQGLYGCDLQPVAVLTTKASLAVSLARFFDPCHPVRLPVYLTDVLNPARREEGLYRCNLHRADGTWTFEIPTRLLDHSDIFALFASIQDLLETEGAADPIFAAVQERFLHALGLEEQQIVKKTIGTLVALHAQCGESIWCSILADRFAAGAIPPVQVICGNPPWIKWSNLPLDYAASLKPHGRELGVFSKGRWVGGIESDISTLITYKVIDTWLADHGRLGFFLPGSVFDTESGAGFRRFALKRHAIPLAVELVEDFKEIRPFADANHHPTFLLLTKNQETLYPVVYRYWKPGGTRRFSSAEEFRQSARALDVLARPLPGKVGGPWLKGTQEEHEVWQQIFTPGEPHYTARKGVTTDMNGVFWVQVQEISPDGKTCRIQNIPALGRKPELPAISQMVETEHLFPLLRGKGVSAFCARPVQDLRILLPQRGMHADPELPTASPCTWHFLAQFKEYLADRSSLKRFQRHRPYWSLWNTGAYTFARYKVLWKEISGHCFAAAYIGVFDDPLLGPKIVVPDHKLYFVPVETEAEAAYLTGILNAPLVGQAVSAYASQLSLGVSVVEYLSLPPMDAGNTAHAQIVALSMQLTQKGGASDTEYRDLDLLAKKILGVG